jgi:hypothetical protein
MTNRTARSFCFLAGRTEILVRKAASRWVSSQRDSIRSNATGSIVKFCFLTISFAVTAKETDAVRINRKTVRGVFL